MERAREFLASGRYLWNNGMFIWRADLILSLIDRHLPELAAGLAEIRGLAGPAYKEKLGEVYLSPST